MSSGEQEAGELVCPACLWGISSEDRRCPSCGALTNRVLPEATTSELEAGPTAASQGQGSSPAPDLRPKPAMPRDRPLSGDPWGSDAPDVGDAADRPEAPRPGCLVLTTTRFRMELAPGSVLTLGRESPSPLSGQRGVGPWVSARHALVNTSADGRVVSVVDCDSTNGSWLNGRQLVPGVPERVDIGDRLVLGQAHPVTLEFLS